MKMGALLLILKKSERLQSILCILAHQQTGQPRGNGQIPRNTKHSKTQSGRKRKCEQIHNYKAVTKKKSHDREKTRT